jgi:hypothetical protein
VIPGWEVLAGREAQRDPAGPGPGGRGFLARRQTVQEVDRGEVGQTRDEHVGKLLSRMRDVECRSDAGGGFIEEGQSFPSTVAVGDVDDQVGDAQASAVRSAQRER